MLHRVQSVTLLATLAIASAVLADSRVIRLSEPVATTPHYEDFGAPLPDEPNARRLADVLAAGNETTAMPVTVTARIARVCQKKGCFFIAQDDSTMARVEFENYGFFVPTDSAGKTVILVARIERQSLSTERAAHLNEDLGEAGVAEAGDEVLLVASAVRIPRQQ